MVRELNKHFQRPDLVILLDIPVEVAMKRMRGKKLDRFEADREFQERVRENYLRLFRREGLPILDACQEPARLEEEIRKLIAPLLSKR